MEHDSSRSETVQRVEFRPDRDEFCVSEINAALTRITLCQSIMTSGQLGFHSSGFACRVRESQRYATSLFIALMREMQGAEFYDIKPPPNFGLGAELGNQPTQQGVWYQEILTRNYVSVNPQRSAVCHIGFHRTDGLVFVVAQQAA